MKISVFAIPEMKLGKVNVKDSRLDEVDKITKSKKKTYVQVELVGEDGLIDSDAILTLADARTDLILKDLEFVESRMTRATEEAEKNVLEKLKLALEQEKLISQLELSAEEKKIIAIYGLLTTKAICAAEKAELDNLDSLLSKLLKDAGFISFFTTGEKETRAWLIKKGATAWEASGSIHSDIQQGFIRAEIISLADFIQAGGENAAKQAGKMRLEAKDYAMQDADLTNFRFNK